MVIFGTALLAACYLLGAYIGELIGMAINVKANVGGVGIAMLLLIFAVQFLRDKGWFVPATEKGITFWAMMYIPVVVAMAAGQNVIVAFKSGPLALIAAVGSFGLCFIVVGLINTIIHRRLGGVVWNPDSPVDTK